MSNPFGFMGQQAAIVGMNWAPPVTVYPDFPLLVQA